MSPELQARLHVLKIVSEDPKITERIENRDTPISPKFENAVTPRGDVALPLRHPYKEATRGSLDGTRLMPGDAIAVPEDLRRTTWTKDLKDWTQIFYQFGLGAAAIQVIRN